MFGADACRFRDSVLLCRSRTNPIIKSTNIPCNDKKQCGGGGRLLYFWGKIGEPGVSLSFGCMCRVKSCSMDREYFLKVVLNS